MGEDVSMQYPGDFYKKLRNISQELYTDAGSRQRYAKDQVEEPEFWHQPEAIILPHTPQEISQIMILATQYRCPVTPRGGGSGLSGGAIPIQGGLVLDLSRMNHISLIDRRELMVEVEAGVITSRLERVLAKEKLFFPGYPMSEDISQLGGNAATDAGGSRSLKYGTTRHWVTGAEVVLPTGSIIRLGGKRIKDATGYSLLQLLIGSEGTLGIFTSLTLRLLPLPAARAGLLLAGKNIAEVMRFVLDCRLNVSVSAIELVDHSSMEMLEFSHPLANAEFFLLLELEAPEEDMIREYYTRIKTMAFQYDLSVIREASNAKELEALWKIRKQVPWIAKRRMGKRRSGEDIVVPVTQIEEFFLQKERISAAYRVPLLVFGHVGDGSLHVHPFPPVDLSSEEWAYTHQELRKELYQLVLSLGGTISAEHGIGHKRRDFLGLAISDAELSLYRSLKDSFDPKGILNPGKILPS